MTCITNNQIVYIIQQSLRCYGCENKGKKPITLTRIGNYASSKAVKR